MWPSTGGAAPARPRWPRGCKRIWIAAFSTWTISFSAPSSGQPVTYRPFSCAQQQLGAPVTAASCRLAIVEGAYACHPDLWAYYDLRVFLTVDPETQMQRIEARSGAAKAAQFRDRWIPFEETYFSALDVQARCDMCISG